MSDYGTAREHVTLFGIGAGWVLAITATVILIGGGIWGITVLTSGVKGRGDAIRIKNSGVNRVQKQEMFEQMNADVAGYVTKIQVAVGAVRAADATSRPLRQTELLGLMQTCVDTVQQYNAESRKYTSRAFKSASLPFTLDATVCHA